MNTSVYYILAALNSEKININDEINWDSVMKFALDHRLHCLVMDHYDKLWSLEYKLTNEYLDWKDFTRRIMVEQLTKNHNASIMIKALNNSNINYIIMKGNDINQYYRNPHVRLMGDIDVLIKKEDIDLVTQVFIEQGYTHNKSKDTEKELAFQKNKSFDFEVHFKLFKDIYYGDIQWFEDLVWERKRKLDAKDFYVMGPNTGLVYLLAHMSKHIKGTGIGLKGLYDIAMYTTGNKDDIDFTEVNEHLKKLKIYSLSMYIFEICKRYLHLDIQLDYNFDEIKLTELFDFLVRAGNFGNTDELLLEKRYEELAKRNNIKIKRWQFVFLSLYEMRKRYKILIKYPILLPFLWLYRSIIVMITKRRTFKIFVVNRISQIKVNERKHLINEMFKDNI